MNRAGGGASISGPFIRRPVATSLLAAAIFLAGLLAYGLLPVAPLPKLDFPTIQVSANLPGASPETMASSVATPLERRFGRIAGVTEITSTSQVGATSITLQFELGRDTDAAARDVQAAIAAAGGELPPSLPFRPTYKKVNPADSPILILALTSATLPLSSIFESANTILAQKLAQVAGVGQVFVGGGQQPAVRVQADPLVLAGAGLTLADVRKAIASSTGDMPKGLLTGANESRVVSANDQLFGAAAFGEVIVARDSKTLAPIRVKDVADVKDDVENNRVAGWMNGTRAVTVILRRQPGANIIETNDRIKKLLPTLAQSISPAIKIEVALDRTQTIRASVRDVEGTLVLSIGLVVAVVFVFLRNVRATIIPSVAVPLSLIGTFGVMYLLGYSLNNLSLMALTISTGFVVDDAIVVTENVARFIEAGDPPFEAALKGARQIGFTIVSITLSLLAVFLPILMMGGLVGRLFREFAVTLAIAIAASAVISLTLTPMMCSRLLTRAPPALSRGPLYRLSERCFDALLRGYDRGLRFCLRHRTVTLLVAVAMVALNVYLFIVVPKGLFPQQDNGLLIGFSEAPQDVSFASMKSRQEAINKIVGEDPDVAHFVSFIGAGPGGSAANTGTVFIDLRPYPARSINADQVLSRLRPKLARVEGISLFLQAAQDIRIGGRPTRTQYQYTIQDADLEELRTWGPRLFERLKKIPGVKDVATDQQTGGLELDVDIDRDTASRLGLSPSDVDAALYDSFGQRQVATVYSSLNQYRVVLETKPEFQKGPDSLKYVWVRAGGGGGSAVPLGAIATTHPGVTPLSVNHQGQFAATTLSFNLAEGTSLGQAIDLIHRAELEIGMPASVTPSFSGTAQAFQASLASEPILIAAALLAVYIVLGVLYESYVHPITILSTLPSAGVGALLALLLTKTEFSVIALIGIILLIGIVKKNAILMIDFAIEAERDGGVSASDAIYQACLLRFRPIMMTTLAALLGGLPLALGGGIGAEFRKPLGVAIVGGLAVSQLLTLFTTPVVYVALDRFTKRKRRHATGAPPVAAPGALV